MGRQPRRAELNDPTRPGRRRRPDLVFLASPATALPSMALPSMVLPRDGHS